MNDLIATSCHVVLRNRLLSSLKSIVLGIMLTALTACGGGGEGTPAISTSSAPTGATASLAWTPVPDPSVTAYQVHFGKQSTGQAGACTYQEVQSVSGPNATITGLDPNTRYFFAVSAYNGLSGPCSNEVSAVTPT